MPSDSLVSIVLPALNCESYIGESLNSLSNQTYKNIEIIVVDGGSCDLTVEITEQAAKADQRIKVYRNGGGLVEDLNYGVQQARGAYIGRMDGDDVAHPQRIERQLEMLSKNGLDICGTAVEWSGEKTGRRYYPLSSEACLYGLTLGTQLAHPTILGRAQVLKTFVYEKQAKYYEDYELWCRMAAKGIKIGNTDFIGLRYRLHKTQGSQVGKREQVLGTLKTMLSYCHAIARQKRNFCLPHRNIRDDDATYSVSIVASNMNLYLKHGLHREIQIYLYSLLPYIDMSRVSALKIAFQRVHLQLINPGYIKILARCFLSAEQYLRVMRCLR